MTKVCQKCSYDCYTCDNNSTCLTCDSHTDRRQIDSNSSRCIPLKGYYDNGSTVSAACPSVCTACLSPSHCTECNYHYYLGRDNMCLYKCSTPLLAKGQQRPTCSNCPYDCMTCDEYGDCLTCNASEHRQLNPANSRCEPMKGYYDDRTFVSKACSSNCKECISPYDCSSCEAGYAFNWTSNKCEEIPAEEMSLGTKLALAAGGLGVLGLLYASFKIWQAHQKAI